MNNTRTLITLNIPNKIKDDFYTVCKVNQSSMTSEIVRFMRNFIVDEVETFKQNRVNDKEINEFKRRIESIPPKHQPQNQQRGWFNMKEPRWDEEGGGYRYYIFIF